MGSRHWHFAVTYLKVVAQAYSIHISALDLLSASPVMLRAALASFHVSSDLSVPFRCHVTGPLIHPHISSDQFRYLLMLYTLLMPYSYQQWCIPFPIRSTCPTISSALQLQYCAWLETSKKKAVFLDFLTLEDKTGKLFRNVGNILPLYVV
jgi:hypothetical protein